MASKDALEKVNCIYFPGREDENKHPWFCTLRAKILVLLAEANHWSMSRLYLKFQMLGCTWFLRERNGLQAPRGTDYD